MLKDLEEHNQKSTILYELTSVAFGVYKTASRTIIISYFVILLNILSGLYGALMSTNKIYLLNIFWLMLLAWLYNDSTKKKNLMKTLLLKNYKIYLSWQKK